VLAGRNLPSEDVLVTLLRALDVTESDISHWVAALDRVRSRRDGGVGASASRSPVRAGKRRIEGPQALELWLIAGAEGAGHFTRRATGQRSRSRGGDLFHGRHAALSTVRSWLTAPEPPDRPLVGH